MKVSWYLASIAVVVGGGLVAAWGGGNNFDRLADADRQVLQERFAKEIWPALQRGGKNSCLNCHGGGGKGAGGLRFKGDPAKDFPMLVKEGFLIPDDSGSILARVTSKDKKQQMPPPGRGDPWTKDDIERLRKFVADVDMKQKK
jgi:mono/diheme cytochrome c family protein